jgi:hypothetical protein
VFESGGGQFSLLQFDCGVFLCEGSLVSVGAGFVGTLYVAVLNKLLRKESQFSVFDFVENLGQNNVLR